MLNNFKLNLNNVEKVWNKTNPFWIGLPNPSFHLELVYLVSHFLFLS